MRYKLQDIIDIEHFQNLQDRLNEIYSFPSSIIDNEGNILTATAWQDICTQFHRKNKETEKLCIQSDQYIKDHIHETNPAISYRCPHGLVDNATPIIIEGIHYGNFFTGQFFLEKPDLEFFRAQAQKYGFDEDAYLEAVKNVPVWTQEQLDSYLFFIKGLIAVISESGLKTLKEIENRKQIEARERRHKSILKTAMDGYWLTDTEGRLLEVNNAYCSMSGYSEDELLTMCIADLDVEENLQLVAQHMQIVISQGSDRFESRHRCKDGSVFDVEVSVQFRNEDGGQCVCFIRDISERRLAEQKLRKSEENFRSLSESSNDYIMRYDHDCRHTYMNPAALAASGLSEGDIIGKTHLESGFPEDLSKIREEKIIQVFETGKPSQTEFSWESANGQVYLDWRLMPEFDADNRVISVLGVSRDITDRKKAEAELTEYSQRLQLATDSGKLAVWDWNVNDNIMFWDKRMFELYGITQETFPNNVDAWINGLHPDDKKRAIEESDAALLGEKEFDTSFRVLHPDGTVKFLKANGMVIRANDGKAVRMIGINSDITERKQAEEEREKLQSQLNQAQKMESVGRLAGGVAHDFNNMLGVILGHVEMALDEINNDHPMFHNLREIHNAAQRSADITRQLLAFARKQTIAPKMIDLNQNVEGMLKMLQRIIGEDVALVWKPGYNLWTVKIDSSQLDQILANLCVNARDAISDVGTITIETNNCVFDKEYCKKNVYFLAGDYVVLSVSDTGSGIDNAALEHIFEPFYTTKGVGKGTGLGLATVYGIVKQNNGFVNVYSEPGRGTTFKIYLPRDMSNVGQSGTEEVLKPAKGGHETILLVEDEPTIMNMTSIMLQRLGYSVTAAGTPGEAIQIVEDSNDEIHLLITDLIMPEMNGKDLSDILLAKKPEMQILFMSGYTANVIAHHGVIDDGVNFIQKPFAKRDLAEKIRQALDD